MVSSSDQDSVKTVEAPVLTISGWKLYTIQFWFFDDFLQDKRYTRQKMDSHLGMSKQALDERYQEANMIQALVFITAFSLGCGCAQTLNQLIAFRTLQGLGGAGLYSVPLIVLPEITPVKQFRILGALIGIAVTVSAVVGPTLGGVIVTHSTWRWVFWFNVPCGGFLIILMLIVCPDFNTFGKIKWTQLDIIGCALYIAVSFLPIFALQEAGAGTFQWSSAPSIVCFVFTGLCLIGLCFWIPYLSNRKGNISPLFPAHIAISRVMVSTIMVSGLVGYTFYTILVELPERFQLVNGKSAEMSGIYLLAVSGASALGCGIGPSLSMKRNNTVPTVTAGCSILLVGLGLMYTIDGSQNIAPRLYGFEVIVGLGLGLVISTTTVMIKLSASIEDAAAAQGLMSQSRLFGGNFGLAIATVVLNKHLEHDLKGTVPDDEITLVRHSLLAVENMNPFQQLAVRNSFVSSFRTDIMICMVVTGVAMLFCVLTWERHPATVQDKLIEAGIIQPPEAQPADDSAQVNSTSTLNTVGEHVVHPLDKIIEPGTADHNMVSPFVRQPARTASSSERNRMADGEWSSNFGRPYRSMPPIFE
ncbi:hypothetical protein KEM54_005452 [Ascosphaera aggregata]|nr:hypothetical protein KEM54_005452 [Ascosphaera aggregata]